MREEILLLTTERIPPNRNEIINLGMVNYTKNILHDDMLMKNKNINSLLEKFKDNCPEGCNCVTGVTVQFFPFPNDFVKILITGTALKIS